MDRMTPRARVVVRASVLAFVLASAPDPGSGQTRWNGGQNVQPVFEGWTANADGSFDMWFGYLNRNYRERPVVPVGADNFLAPGGADQGQPTHFYNRRQQLVFKVRVPADWGDKDLVWTVTHNGRTDKAYASLWPVWELDQNLIGRNRGLTSRVQSSVLEGNRPPSVTVEGAAARSVTLPGAVELAVLVNDDGIPPPNPGLATIKSSIGSGDIDASAVDFRAAAPTGLAVTWLHWRGPGTVAFDPRVPGIVDGRAVTTASFSKPGTYVLRAVADDMVLTTPVDVTVTVIPPASTRRP